MQMYKNSICGETCTHLPISSYSVEIMAAITQMRCGNEMAMAQQANARDSGRETKKKKQPPP